jgi:two-component system chemotaxis response regulator CheB
MKRKLSALTKRYVTALHQHLKQGPRASLRTALELGRQALALGLETSDVTKIHEEAVAALAASSRRDGVLKRAELFFAEAITPLEETHRAACKPSRRLSQLCQTLNRRAVDLAASNGFLKQGIIQRQTAEAELRKNGKDSAKLLRESHQLQKHLRHLTHEILSAQEAERTKISRELQDEVAQTLLGINVRLLTLKQAAKGSPANLKKELANTERLVQESLRSINRFARELDPLASVKRAVHHLIMKPKSKPERRQKKPANAARETTPASPASRSFPVIAMAASVGGLKALSVILGALPADFPAAIAIVMHLSPDHKSILAEILNRRTHLEVKQAHTGDRLCHSNVFVAPPNHHLFVAKGGRLRLSSSASEKVHHARPSAEPLFASVAEIYKKDAIAVVLTGGDGDGSFGVQIIKEKGGKVIAQDRPTSQDFSMPETSIKTGDVDFILPLNDIAPKLIELVGAGRG